MYRDEEQQDVSPITVGQFREIVPNENNYRSRLILP